MSVTNQNPKSLIRKPRWLKRKLPAGPEYEDVRALLKKGRLHTVCQEAKCPNIWECFSRGTSTFLVMGPCCTRNCRFCAVAHGPPAYPDPGEPERVAEAAKIMGLSYVVVTSVARDDLPDGGAGHFAKTIREIRKRMPETFAEVLVPDFKGDFNALQTVIKAHPDVLNHNLETVPRLYASARPGALYHRSLDLLKQAKQIDPAIPTKSGLMLGLGEASGEIEKTLQDLLDSGCSILTLGQYLQPTRKHLPVKRYIPPEEFDCWKETALEMGFSGVASGPLVRSSYHAKELFQEVAAV
ncbi:lipoyl synthase [candidate division KSB1 bacterium]|nr:MAG: lipoyl synthase [candidate division KSB1 bacterium]